jgi:glucose-1-phosphate thymidylyltransferase
MEPLKGVVLAGGLGRRLHPLTKVTNKHLLPVYDRPMICYPIETLVGAGIRDILLVTGGSHAGEFLRLLGRGKALGLDHLSYTYQEGEGGIADALALARDFAAGQRLVVALGDNILEDSIAPFVEAFRRQPSGARLLLKRVRDPERFGVAEIRGGRIVRIVEKPAQPPSPYVVTGVYMYDASVFDIIDRLQPSARGELEITDVNNAYIARGELEHDLLPGWWSDAGTFESLHSASVLVRECRLGRLAPGGALSRA